MGKWQLECHHRSCCGSGKAISLTTHPPCHSFRRRWPSVGKVSIILFLSTTIPAFTIRTKDVKGLPLVTSVRLGNGCIVPAIYPIRSWQWKSTWWQTRMRPLLLIGYLTTRHQPTSRATRYGPNNISRYVLVQICSGSNFPSLYCLFNWARNYKLADREGRTTYLVCSERLAWRGYFGRLGNWTKKRMKDLGKWILKKSQIIKPLIITRFTVWS